MSFDGIVTNAVVKELNSTILGGRIDKIYQPEKDELFINIHKNGTNYRLIMSASSNNPRIYLTAGSKKNPDTPPMFCMLLRKHISGGIVLNIEQYEMDRVVFIDISSQDELGQPTEKRLVIEIMGKHSNIILMEKSSSRIIDSIKRVTDEMSRVRQILPGSIYENPPIKDKKNPLKTNQEEFMQLISNEAKNTSLSKFFYYNYLGLSPLISREILFEYLDDDRTIISLSEDDIKTLYDGFKSLIDRIVEGKFSPLYITNRDESEIIAFHCLDLNQFGTENKNYLDSISEVLDFCYRKKDVLDRISQKSQSIRKSLGIKLDRALSKLGKQKEELFESMDREKYKIYADLISANIHKIYKGLKEVELENFYDIDMKTLIIPLDIKLSPVENAQRYYKKYSKLKNANNLLLEQIPASEAEIEYLENVLISIENSTEIHELDEIKEELINEGYLKPNSKTKKKKKKEEVSPPQHYISSDGFDIYVGKNNRQNDYLTMKFAHKEDTWLHVQQMPGSHVLIKSEGKEIPLSTLEEAANLAAYYSKGKNSNHVAVDYTKRKNVKKPKNAKIGLVIYENFSTIIVNPTQKNIQHLKKVD